MRKLHAALVVACLVSPAAAAAANLIPVEDFARHASLSMPRLSPDGQHIALRMDDGDSHALVIFDVADMSRPVSMLRMPVNEVPANVAWVSPTRLIVEKGKLFGSIDRPQLTGEILATNVDGSHQDYLFGYQAGYGTRGSTRQADDGWGSVDGLPAKANGHFYLGAHDWVERDRSVLYDVDAMKNVRHLIGDIGVGQLDFLVGPDGKVEFAFGTDTGFEYVAYQSINGHWAQLGRAQAGKFFAPFATTPDGRHVYAWYSVEGGPAELIEQQLDGGDRKVLAKDDFGSIDDVQWTAPPRQPFAVATATGAPRPIYIDPALPAAKLYAAISQKFPGEFVDFIDFSEDGRELLFSVGSDRDPGSYYLIDTGHYKVRRLFAAAPWIDPAKMAERVPMHFKASDGMELEAILTVPNGVPMNKLPMVLLPHGGPHGVSDDWFFDWDAQFLASRGYLVLQVNYRGSSGRGVNFEQAGYLQWGTRIQQDLIDGVQWAEQQQYADPDRVCVYGGSFGGYSALMSVIRAPKLFKCAIGYAGVYDLAMMYRKGSIGSDTFGKNYLTAVIGKDDAALAANSPDKLADRIDVPVLLIHGEADQRVPFAQAKAMRAALDAAHKPYEWMAKSGEGHGFYTEANNVDRLNLMQAFLAKYIGKGTTPP
ncbi:alpha/beta hydrolase family protein [Rhodanobacter geophilus]|uniref:Alpha/beta hydrolase family protein n=1 Tax=Rhodanobacter geophilus TaxID=3162488 RepID=A0ABV3QN99_9GAMM